MTPEEREAAMLEYRRRNDEEEIRLRGAQGALDATVNTRHQIPLDAIVAPQAAPEAAPEETPQETPEADPVVVDILENEGGYQQIEEDKGNYNSKGELVGTNHGISGRMYEKFIGRPPTAEDMQELPIEEAVAIYEKEYIQPAEQKLDIDSSHPAYQQIIDMFVKEGEPSAVAIIQRATGAKVDGKAGPQTRKKLAAVDPVELNNRLVEERKKQIKRKVKEDPSQSVFLNGWMSRADKYLIAPRQIADGQPALQEDMRRLIDEALAMGATEQEITQILKGNPTGMAYLNTT